MSVEHIVVNGHELTAFDLPPKPEEYTVTVDGLGEIHVIKGEPKTQRDWDALAKNKLKLAGDAE